MIIKRVLTVGLVGLAGLALIAGLPVPAHASSTCLSGHLCVYVDANYGGAEEEWQTPARGACIDLTGTSFNNAISSMRNNLPESVTFHLGSCLDGSHATLASGGATPNLAGSGWNDGITSIHID